MATDTTAADPLGDALLEHARRGVRLQLLLRMVLVVFVVLTVSLVPPVGDVGVFYAVLAAYLLWTVAFGVWIERGDPAPVRLAWSALLADVAVLAVLTLLASVGARDSWTSDVLTNGFFLIPVLAATDLRPRVCLAAVVPTVVVSLVSGLATQAANAEPLAAILLDNVALAGVGAGCVALSHIQRSRVQTIGRLLSDRTAMLDELMRIDDRERRILAENLHDGALQYVLAARQDLDDVRDVAGPAIERIEHALTESSRLLRSTVTELHPAVLERAGLARAVADLARTSADRGGFTVDIDDLDWPDDLRTPVDPLLFGAARELLTNVVRHAGATSVRVELDRRGDTARLVVADDGAGIGEGALADGLERGHIGLPSQRLRIEAAGGSLTLAPARPTGTVATVEVPCPS